MTTNNHPTQLPLVLLLIVSLFFAGCTEEELPTDLSATVSIDDGKVTVTATAVNAAFYSFVFTDGSGTTNAEDANGLATYTYTANGTYDIIIRAHANATEFIEITETVTVVPDYTTGFIPTTGYTSPMSRNGYTLVWNDEFEGTSLSDDYTFEIGNGDWGWGNNELEYYRELNTKVKDGLLMITAREEAFGGFDYTSSRIITKGKQSFQKGRIDVRASLPSGQGIWPAIWMLGDNFDEVGWPHCGEIDIMEMVGGSGDKNATVHGTIHWDNGGHKFSGNGTTLSSGILADEFHVFSIIWDDTHIKWLLDDVQYHIVNISTTDKTEFHQEFFFIFNVAVGGNWPGSPDANTTFPQTMAIDYVRVFQIGG